MAELAKLSEKQQRGILPNGKRTVYLDLIGRGLTYLKLWGAVDSPRRGQQIISEKGAELIWHYPQGIPAEVVAEIVLTARKAGTQPNTKESIQAPENNIADVAESTPEELITESVAQLESALATIFWSACVCSPLVLSSSWWWLFCWRWAMAAARAAAWLPRRLMMAVLTV